MHWELYWLITLSFLLILELIFTRFIFFCIGSATLPPLILGLCGVNTTIQFGAFVICLPIFFFIILRYVRKRDYKRIQDIRFISKYIIERLKSVTSTVTVHVNRFTNFYSFLLIIIGSSWFFYLLIDIIINLPRVRISPNKDIPQLDNITAEFLNSISNKIRELLASATILISGFSLKWLDNNRYRNDFFKSLSVAALAGGFIIYLIILKINPSPVFYAKRVPDDWWAAIGVLAALFLGVLGIEIIKIREISNFKSEIGSKLKDFEEYITIRKIIYEDLYGENISEYEKWNRAYNQLSTIKNPNYINNFSYIAWSYAAWKDNVPDIAKKMRKEAYKINPNDPWSSIFYANILIDESYEMKNNAIAGPSKDYNRYETMDIIKNVYEKSYPAHKSIKPSLEVAYGKLFWRDEKYDDALFYFSKANKHKTQRQNWISIYYIIALLIGKSKSSATASSNKKDENKKEKSNSVSLNPCDINLNAIKAVRAKMDDDIPYSDISFEAFKAFTDAWLAIYQNSDGVFNKDVAKIISKFYRCFSPLHSLEFSSMPIVDRYSFHFIYKKLNSIYGDQPNWKELSKLYLTFYHFFGACDLDAQAKLKNGGNGNGNESYSEIIEREILKHWNIGQLETNQLSGIKGTNN